ncbi:hypothetical protein L596_021985 [Steinernema carpocapsae]|uniref:7TM GPCR serpentine receptor class x (Srx) domain-containing protein n=1 Tax=Steinernema carpocapsae TaxID=34508 RepID=A0A4U5ML81_STECR|nr:hypothetical protein L596_021985 [Steinernema carpocapsae]
MLTSVRLTSAAIYALIALVTVTLNILLIIVLVHMRSRNGKLKRSFFFFIWQIIICGLISQFVEIVLVVPGTFAGYDFFGSVYPPRAIAFFDTLSYNGLLYFSLVLATSRLTAIALPRINEALFEGRRIFWSISFVWAVDWIFVIVTNVTGCWNTFDFKGFFLKHECVKDKSEFATLFGRVIGLPESFGFEFGSGSDRVTRKLRARV